MHADRRYDDHYHPMEFARLPWYLAAGDSANRLRDQGSLINGTGEARPRQLHYAPSVATTKDIDPWWRRAVCRDADSEIFFGKQGTGYKEARAMCNVCPVILDCLYETLATESGDLRYGFRAGLTPEDRKKLVKVALETHVVPGGTRDADP